MLQQNRATSAFHYRITREFLTYDKFYKNECFPLFQSLNPFTLKWIMTCVDPNLSQCITRDNGSIYSSIRDVIHDTQKQNSFDSSPCFSALKWLRLAEARAKNSNLVTLNHSEYAFQVGDIVSHRYLGQVGVVADRLPVCFESDEWVRNQLGSVHDIRMVHPWYLILVARHKEVPPAFTRYGSELSHVKCPKMSIGLHPLLPIYFKGYDNEKGVYIPRVNHQMNMSFMCSSAVTPEVSLGSMFDPKGEMTAEAQS
eukprot:Tbor_TRINITY_DN1843_c0_g1::TRINITY_DN1843_c0_g1_i1::g.23071::m.23071